MIAALLAAGCGLPSPYYLSPPATPGYIAGTQSALPGTPYFYVISTTDNSEAEFRGFELYYKCYLDAGGIEMNFGSSSFESTLRSVGFKPVCSEDDTSPSAHSAPLIPIAPADRGKPFVVKVDFDSLGGGLYKAIYSYTRPDTAIVVSKGVRRYAIDAAVSCKTFDFAQFVSTDADFSIGGSVSPGGPFFIAIYALSYGLQDISTPIWSWPVYLGYVEIRL
jgi:hypothetical protein